MTLNEAKQGEIAARLSVVQGSKGWLSVAKAEARHRLQAAGLPGKRDEYWRYTDPARLISATPMAAALFDVGDEPMVFETMDRLKLVFVDGIFEPTLSDDVTLSGVSITALEAADSAAWAKEYYGVLEARGQNPVPRTLATLNSAQAEQGFLIHVTGRASRPISLIYMQKSENSDAMIHHVIRVETAASVTLLENGPAAARLNQVIEVSVADGGQFHHIRSQGRTHKRRAVTHIFAQLGAGALFKSFTLTANGALTRNEAVIEMNGDDAIAHVAGAAVGDGAFHHDDTVFVTHAAERCESRQVYKKVLKNGAVGVFQGKILVKSGAQKTDGYQISQALLLDDDCQFLAKPELEIYADDVKCSHGSTSGAIDDTALFYLRSRGVPLRAAQSLLVLAFLAEAIAEIEDEDIAEDIRSRLESWLARHEH